MKTLKLYYLLLLLPLLLSCEGPMGPEGLPGPQGPRGPQGPETVALMYEKTFSLNANNNWKFLYEFPAKDVIYAEDVVLVYMLWDVDNGTDVWRLMPVSYFSSDGLLQINYDFTQYDVKFFAEASFPLDAKLDKFTDLLARIVVVPADFSPNQRKGGIDYSNFEEVKQVLGIKDFKRGEAALAKNFFRPEI